MFELEGMKIGVHSEDWPNLKEGVRAHKEFEMLKKQDLELFTSRPVKHVLNEIYLSAGHFPLICIAYAFNYGYILGKRTERKKHRKK